ncbi:MAG TPA: glycosyltransferase [Arachidicoccus sp.]|nr:glycosyltransferase [Arachidicoccus sp.]
MNIVVIGPAHPLRGGLASFDERLSRQFIAEGHQVTLYTFSLQYPGFLFPGTTQYSSAPKPADLDIRVCINSINPLNWRKVGHALREEKPDLIVIRYWIPFMGACQGMILRQVKKNKHTKVVCIVDNMIPHEKRPGDGLLTRYFLKPVDGFITMSEKVQQDLRLFTNKPGKLVVHPLFDNFGAAVSKQEARAALKLPAGPIILFFGFIRKYKGLDLLLKAMKILMDRHQLESQAGAARNDNSQIAVLPKLLVAGEFYGGKEEYEELIESLGLARALILRTNFIADSEVRQYLSACDFVIQPYRDATQSGVTPLAYHFEKPMLVTNVGGLPDLVPNEKVGVVVEPDPQAIAAGIDKLYRMGEAYFLPYLHEEKKKYSWANFTAGIFEIMRQA